MIAAIAAVAENGMLGQNNWLPWDIPEELAYFERMVEGAAVLVGRSTYESMVVVSPDTFVLTRDPGYVVRPGCFRVHSVADGLLQAVATGKRVFVIGGASVYAAAWPYCQALYLTRIAIECTGDTRWPENIPLASWRLLRERTENYLDRRSGTRVACRFLHYEQPTPLALSGHAAANHCQTACE